jgi:hypothetical protein
VTVAKRSFCRIFAVLKYPLIGMKFWQRRTAHPVHCKEKKFENFQNFFVLKVLVHLSHFDVKNVFDLI